jgi:hypothetical protein
MASLDSLPADQRAVLELVLQRGRTYDEIAQMLSIDRAGVRQRALAAFDALGPQTRVEPVRRALITDYLLGQLPPRISDETQASLARSPAERAWARVLASELAPLARDPLPEIPAPQPAGAAAQPSGAAPQPSREAPERSEAAATAAAAAMGAQGVAAHPAGSGEERPGAPTPPGRSSRLGGAVLLGLGAAVVIAVVLIVVLTGGSSKKHTSTTAEHTTTPATNTSTTQVRPVAQVNLLPPNGGQAKGIAQIVVSNNVMAVVIFATGVPPNNHNAYAVWLYNSASSSKLVGFVAPGVGSNGQLQTEGRLTADAKNYKQLLVTLETQAHPKSPGQVVLSGALNIP